jgi:hypothetical protein
MLKELNSIARGLLGLHGYPTPASARVAPAPSDASPARRPQPPRRQRKTRPPAGTTSGRVSLQA